jgi:hypothetical protein
VASRLRLLVATGGTVAGLLLAACGSGGGTATLSLPSTTLAVTKPTVPETSVPTRTTTDAGTSTEPSRTTEATGTSTESGAASDAGTTTESATTAEPGTSTESGATSEPGTSTESGTTAEPGTTAEAPTTAASTPAASTAEPAATAAAATGATTEASTAESSGTESWVWIVAVLTAVGLAAVGVAAWLSARRKTAAYAAWRVKASPLTTEARQAKGMLLDPASATDAGHRAAVEREVGTTLGALDRLAAEAPDAPARLAARELSEALRGLSFAVEANRLVRDPSHTPTTEELVQADASVASHTRRLDAAIEQFRLRAGPTDVSGAAA